MTRLASLLLIACSSAAPQTWKAVELKHEGDRIDILVGGQPFTTYCIGPAAAKPYIFPLRSAQGTVVTRSFPLVADVRNEDHDEPHQRAMYFAHGDINGYDFWGEAEFARWSRHSVSTFVRTVFREVDTMRDGAGAGTLRAEFNLTTSNGSVIGTETQAYSFSGDERLRIIDCEFTLHADHGPLKIGDTKEGTFAIRLVKALEAPTAHMINSAGAAGEKGIWGRRADWVDFYGNVAGGSVGVAVFDSPRNMPHPAYWHARGYGLLSVNPFGLKEFLHDRHRDGSYVIPAGGSLTLRYRVFIHDGDLREARVAQAYTEYAENEKRNQNGIGR
jgi:hypothetical protein